ncbi:hypothetical protein ACA910_020070 [Epithemia clementina (nom. ined.)]
MSSPVSPPSDPAPGDTTAPSEVLAVTTSIPMPMQAPAALPWLDRVKTLLGPRGYDHSMRRSIQTLVIYEAKRCIQACVGDLRPFQRKVALVDQAQALVSMLDFCLPHHKAEILWRTSTSRETVTPEICWKRFQLIQKELDRLAEQIKPFMAPERSHQEAVDLLEQHLFETSGDNQGKPNSGKIVPPNWGHAHNHVLLCFRLYYRGDQLDPDFPDPVPPKNICVPAMPTSKEGGSSRVKSDADAVDLAGDIPLLPSTSSTTSGGGGKGKHGGASAANGAGGALAPNPSDERRRLLQEVREHLDLLREFEDVAPDEELIKRKKELYAALPPAPPPFGFTPNKKTRYV